MKKGVLLLLSALTFGSLTSGVLTSCSTMKVGNAKIELQFKDKTCLASIKNPKSTYNSGDVIALEIVLNEGYSLEYVTLNETVVEDVQNITLVEGTNIIRVYTKHNVNSEGSTNLRDFTFQENNDGTVSIVSYNPSGIFPSTLEIPSTYNGKTVTKVLYIMNQDGSVVSDYSIGGIKKVAIPASIKEIDARVFMRNLSIDEFVVDSANETFASKDKNLYTKDLSKLVSFAHASTNDFVIADEATEIGEFAFFGANDLKTVNLKNKITKIGNHAFYGCGSLENIVIPDSVTTIGESCFQTCTSLKTVKLSNKLSAIAQYTFRQCNALKSIEIPGSVKTVAQYAFFDDKALAEIKFNEGTTKFNDFAFAYVGAKELALPSTLKSIGKYTFTGCDYLTKVTFNEGLTSIGQSAFDTCKLLGDIKLPASLTSIDNLAFNACLSISKYEVASTNANFTAKDGVLFTKDGTRLIAYPNSKKDKSYRIPDGTTALGFRCFGYVSQNPAQQSSSFYSLRELTIPFSVTTMENPFFGGQLEAIKYEGTIEDFAKINSEITFEETNYTWYDGSNGLENKVQYLGRA